MSRKPTIGSDTTSWDPEDNTHTRTHSHIHTQTLAQNTQKAGVNKRWLAHEKQQLTSGTDTKALKRPQVPLPHEGLQVCVRCTDAHTLSISRASHTHTSRRDCNYKDSHNVASRYAASVIASPVATWQQQSLATAGCSVCRSLPRLPCPASPAPPPEVFPHLNIYERGTADRRHRLESPVSSAVTVISVKGSFLSSNLSPSEEMSDQSCGWGVRLSANAPTQHNWQKVGIHLTARRSADIQGFLASELTRIVKYDDGVRSASWENTKGEERFASKSNYFVCRKTKESTASVVFFFFCSFFLGSSSSSLLFNLSV